MKNKNIVVLTGAGISAESGISTFRDSGGLWEKYKIEDVATPEGFAKNPSLVLDFYNKRRRECLKAQPNKAHYLLATLEDRFDVSIITQNVDDLHERAGSSNVLHLHGELMKARSSTDPNNIQLLEAIDPDIKLGDESSDGSQLRPHIVWFGEPVPKIEEASRIVEIADILLIVGTSLNVYPAAGLINFVDNSSVPIYLIDPNKVDVSHTNVFFIRDIASKGIETFIDKIS